MTSIRSYQSVRTGGRRPSSDVDPLTAVAATLDGVEDLLKHETVLEVGLVVDGDDDYLQELLVLVENVCSHPMT